VKAAVVACGVAVLFLGAVLVGVDQRQVGDDRPAPAPIRLREATRPVTEPTPRPSSTRTVDRYVDHRGLDYYDDHGGRRDGSGGGSGSSGGGSDSSGGSGSGRGGGDDGPGDDHSGD
jgi:uncharacterized membrane protein YgcG